MYTSGAPHDTGGQVSTFQVIQARLLNVATWTRAESDEESGSEGEEEGREE